MLTVDEALKKILDDATLGSLKERGNETISLVDALGRISAEDQVSTIAVPPWDNSAMDGYAVCLNDVQSKKALMVSQVIPAGANPKPLRKGTIARIFTGAPIPEGADTVIIQENTKIEGSDVFLLELPKVGANIRNWGEDIKEGSVVVSAGTVLQSAHLGLLASVGIGALAVRKQLKVAIFSTGDELVDPLIQSDTRKPQLKAGQIFNSNRYLLMGMLQQLNCEIVDGGSVVDQPKVTEKKLQALAQQSDIVISTGGVSVGDEDHVKSAMLQVGELNLWKIAIKPGKPLAFGKINTDNKKQIPFFGLPGNPVSAYVTFLVFVKPFILAAQRNEQEIVHLTAKADFDWPSKKPDQERLPLKREEYLRARVKAESNRVEIYPTQSSGALSSVAWANCLAIAPVGTVINKGDKIKLLML